MSLAWWWTVPSLIALGFAAANIFSALLDMFHERRKGRRGSTLWVMATHGVIVQALVLYHALAFAVVGIFALTKIKSKIVGDVLTVAFIGSAWAVMGIAVMWAWTRKRVTRMEAKHEADAA